ncbi:MAG: ABC transporter permease [Deinococcus sp.]|nr:ABC transporter permease [Deinococcus sp.]MCL5964362.1 ABC transporter permease [Deinococcus sp.]
MWTYTFRRLGLAILTLWLASTLVFMVVLFIPGDPVATILGMDANPDVAEKLRHDLGLDRPPLERYFSWLAGVATGDLGTSIRYGISVGGLILKSLTLTLPIVLLSLMLATVIAVPLGILAARRAGGALDFAASLFALLGLALPSFWVGLMFIYLFAVNLGWLPSNGFPQKGWADPLNALKYLALPVLTIGLARSALLTRMVRGSLLEVLSQDYVRTARGKGLSERVVVNKHALKNAALPVVTVLGLEFAQLLIAAVVVEQVFGLPGLGSLALTGIQARDYPLVQGVVLVLAMFIVALNLVVDLLYGYLDPRVSYG